MKSRVGRLEWWGTFIVAYFLYLQATEFLSRSVSGDGGSLSGASIQSPVLLGVAQAVSLAVALAVQGHVSIRRAHDRDVRPISFWVYAATSVVTFAVGFSISALGISLPLKPSWLWTPQFLAFGWAAIELGGRPGDPTANRWGPVPKPLFNMVGPRADNYKPPRM
ncbi:DUF805 domain-containing protein [Brevundimonas sp.]|uniref:DUF805 domain-containing protein n=1 Tax=Brevundimonas sp. TaxID=1871086 RepID=UPI0035617D7C